jgi:ATP-dependent exoDNAse (exonuclease V) alpha subunit
MLFIERNPDDPNSQDVHLMVGSPVIAIRNNKTVGIVNGETFAVKSLNPLLICSKVTGDVVELTPNLFRDNFYVNFCSTVHKCQGETYTEPFTIHEWNRMSTKMKYTAISRATRKNLINVMPDKEPERANLPDTDHRKLKERQKRAQRDNERLHKKRKEALVIINRIIRDDNVSDEYCLKHTFQTRIGLLEYLGIENGIVPKGYEIDHIKPRHQHVTDDDFEEVNAYWNLRLLSRNDNNSRNWL